jgi:hypothetical protein
MPRPPIGPQAMDHTVKFRLRADEYRMLQQIAGSQPVSEALRRLIHDEGTRRRKAK